jgi:hypothetical protein
MRGNGGYEAGCGDTAGAPERDTEGAGDEPPGTAIAEDDGLRGDAATMDPEGVGDEAEPCVAIGRTDDDPRPRTGDTPPSAGRSDDWAFTGSSPILRSNLASNRRPRETIP